MRIFLLLIILLPSLSFSQTAPDKYWVQFTDKPSQFSLEAPQEFLSQRAIDRRIRQGIAFDADDLPVHQSYVDQVSQLGDVQVLHRSKWFNAITIKITDPLLLEEISNLPFVAQTRSVKCYTIPEVEFDRIEDERRFTEYDTSVYGESLRQIEMVNGHLLHAADFTGEGLQIAVMDAGFRRSRELPIFDYLRAEGKITEQNDLVEWWDTDVNGHSNHGTWVLSIMGGYMPDSLIGTAPDAHYFLFRTEDSESEFIIEEDNWVAAIEEADSLGIDLVNTSLGYSEYDDPTLDHDYSNMDGRTARISIASTIAARKGMLLVTSAGNKGLSSWKYITAPADADSILTVGAVDATGTHAGFSSFGPSFDGRVKPNVVTMGESTVIADLDSTIRRGNGTSFSAPVLCGLAACLWQAHPSKTNMEVLKAIEQSAHLFSNPNDSLGFGIPDFWKAHLILRGDAEENTDQITLYPNPSKGPMRLELKLNAALNEAPEFDIFGNDGKLVAQGCLNYFGDRILHSFDYAHLNAGSYVLRVRTPEQNFTKRFVISDR